MSVHEDLRKKLLLEKQLSPELKRYHAMLLRRFTDLYARIGATLTMRQFDDQLTAILENHYAAAKAAFTGSISGDMPPEAALTKPEQAAIAAALVAYFSRTAKKRAEQINQTTADDLQTAVRLAVETQQPDKPPLSRVEVAFLAAGIAHRVLSNRAESIMVTETQLPSEATKATEAEVLLGLTPTVSGGGHRVEQATKQWDSVGDNRVREGHLAADGTQGPVKDPFIVDGESLMFPGDTSLGASTGNVINCRCSASYNTAEIAEQRQEV